MQIVQILVYKDFSYQSFFTERQSIKFFFSIFI